MKINIHYCLIAIVILAFAGFQANAQCSVLNATSSLSFTASGGSKTIFVQTDPADCNTYSISQVGTFFSYYRSGTDVSVSCDVNTSTFSRTGRIELDGSRYVTISQEAACPPQDPPGDITGTGTVCINGTGTYSTTAVAGADYYVWSVSSGGEVVSGQGSLIANIYFSTSGSKTVYVTARNSCLNYSSSKTYAVNVVAKPAAPTSISHNPNMCGGNNYTFSVVPQTGFTYEWVVEGSGYAILGGQGTSSISVSVAAGEGIIRVRYVNSSGCKSDQYSKTVSGAAGSPVFYVSGNGSICPGASTTIHLDGSALNYVYTAYRDGAGIIDESSSAVTSLSGTNSSLTFGPFTKEGNYTIESSGDICPVEMNGSVPLVFKPAIPDQPGTITKSVETLCINTSASFSILPVDRASAYTWSTSGSSSISGQGTSNATITFHSSGTQTVYVNASNSCGTSPSASTPITVVANPAAPTSISHNPNMCGGNNYTFSVPPQTGFTYEWVVEGSGYAILAGQGTSSINVSVPAGEGIIRVKAINSTGCKSDQYSKPVSGAAGSPVFYVSGNGSICPGASTTIHLDGSALNYVYTAYRDGAGIIDESSSAVTSLSGTNSSLTFGPFTKAGTYTIESSGDYCPVEMNGSVPLVFKPATPDQPGLISASPTSICNGGTIDFSINPVARATSYTWSSSQGPVIIGQNTNNATIQFSTSANQALVKVTANNSCGISPDSSRYIYITHVAAPAFIPSYPNPCAGGKYTYSVNPNGDYFYTWEVPSDWEILGGQGTSSIQIKLGRYDGTIKVKASKNGCSSSTTELYQDIVQPPGVFALSGSGVICEGQSFSLSLNSSVTGYDYTLMRGNTSVTTIPGTNSPLTFGPYTTPGTYKVYSNSSGSCIYPMDGEAIITLETLSVAPASIDASSIETCPEEDIILTASGGILGHGAVWKWYTGSCSGTAIGTGSSISVRPVANTIYYVRAEGNCNITACASASINIVSCLDRSTFNYTRIRTPQKAGYVTLPANSPEDNITTDYVYIDELGRKAQRVTISGSPSRNDVFSINVYDLYGRERFQYLPATLAGNAGMFINDASNKIIDFYLTGNPSHPLNVAESSAPFAETIFESSPLNRPLKQGAPGEPWQPVDTDPMSINDNTVKKRYETNGASEVLLFKYDPASGLVSLDSDPEFKHYGANQLYANKILDEHNNEVIEYADKEGRTVCRKVQYKTETDGTKQYASTYYIYDGFGTLALVLPPEGVKEIMGIINQN